jgi:pilus assembly protein CpaB
MNNTVLRIISVLLALGALVVAYFAIQLSNAPPAPVAAPQPPAQVPHEVVAVATRAIKVGQILVAQDVALKNTPQPPSSAYRQVQEVVGRVAAADIAADQALTPTQFMADAISYLLKQSERAVGIQIDEVNSVGGFAKPGEHVDILAFLPADGANQSSAQVVIENARLLSLGDSTALDNAPQGESTTVDTLAKSSGAQGVAELKERRLHLKSAVVAVRDSDVTRLMLAANAGSLRLALRPPMMPPDPNSKALGMSAAPPVKAAAVALSDLGMRRATGGGTGRKLIVQDGSKEREVNSLGMRVQP